jgi:hypothetical protein
VEDFLADHGGELGDYVFLPVRSRYRKLLLAFRRATGELVDWLDVELPSRVMVKGKVPPEPTASS